MWTTVWHITKIMPCRGTVYKGGGGAVSAHRAQGAHAGDAGGAAPGRHERAILLEPQLQHDSLHDVHGFAALPGLGRYAALHQDAPGTGPVLQGVRHTR